MRRHSEAGGALPAGSSRALRLDPQALPLSFVAQDRGADHRVRVVELTAEHVVLRRAVSGVRMAVKVPVAAYLGVAVRIVPAAVRTPASVSVSLEHRDPALSVPLFRAEDTVDVIAEWQRWARLFRLPLLTVDAAGGLREPFARIGAVRVGAVRPRRRRRNAIRARRPSFLMRRRCGYPKPGIGNRESAISNQ